MAKISPLMCSSYFQAIILTQGYNSTFTAHFPLIILMLQFISRIGISYINYFCLSLVFDISRNGDIAMKKIFYYETPIGKIALAEQEGKITDLFLKPKNLDKGYIIKETDLLKEAGRQLKEYFDGERKDFSLPLAPEGTPFMKRVWKSLEKIPYGETKSYKDIAIASGCNKAYRAVGMANNKNPIAIIIPCHRVIGADKKLVGYGGGLDIKEFLLRHEGVYLG